jgi:hypothetical protein
LLRANGGGVFRSVREKCEVGMGRSVQLFVWVVLAMVLATGMAWAASKTGTDGNDRLRGTPQADDIDAKAGNDVARGKKGSDHIWGRYGEDKLYGGWGKDKVNGGRHNDTLDGGPRNDVVRGGQGRDDIWGGTGTDRLFGGKGNDEIHTGGDFPDVVDCGPGRRDWVSYDSTDQVVNCERKEFRGDTSETTALRKSSATPVAD